MDGVKWVSSSVSCYSFNHLQQTWKAFLIHVIWRRVEGSVYLNWKRDMVRATGVKLCTQFLNNVSRHWNMSFESMREATEQQISNHSFEINFIYFFFLKKWEENALREWSSSTRPKSASQFWTKWSGLPFIKWKELNKNFPLQEKFNSNISFLTGWQFSCKLCFESEPLMASVLFFS